MSRNDRGGNSPGSLEQGTSVTESIFDRPIWETIGRRMKRINLSENALPAYGNPYFAGMGIGVALFFAFFMVGRGFGDSGAMTRIFAFAMSEVVPSHTDTLVYFRRYLSTSQHPLFHWVVLVMVGSALGGLVSGMRGRRMKMEFTRGPRASVKFRIFTALIGGVLVAFGARMAGGCITGLAITGGAVLSVASWIFFLTAVTVGMVVAFFFRKLWL